MLFHFYINVETHQKVAKLCFVSHYWVISITCIKELIVTVKFLVCDLYIDLVMLMKRMANGGERNHKPQNEDLFYPIIRRKTTLKALISISDHMIAPARLKQPFA